MRARAGRRALRSERSQGEPGRSDDGVEITRHVELNLMFGLRRAVRRDGFAPPYPDNWHAATDVVVDAEAEHLADAPHVLSPQMCDVVLAAAQP